MSFLRYPKYKDSGVEWWGDMPQVWDLFPAKRSFIRKKELNTGMKCENRLSLTLAGVVPRDLDDLDGLQASEFETYQIFSADDLVFKLIDLQNIKTSRVGLVPEMGIMSPAYIRVEPNKVKVVPKFAYWFFTNLYNRCIFNELGGGVRQTISSEELLLLPYPAIPLFEQAQIAAFLDRETAMIDGLVVEQRRLVELLKEKRQAVISHAVTKGLNPHAPMKPSGIEWLGDVPGHWEVTPLKYVVNLRSGGTPSKAKLDYWDGDVPWASSKDLKVETLSDTQDHISQSAIDDGAADLVPAGSLLIVVRGMILIHTFPVVKTLVPMAINQDLKALTPSPKLNVDFLAWLLRGASRETLGRIDEAAHGTKVLRIEAWTSIELPIPPLDEQLEIVEGIINHMGKLDTLTAEAQRAIDLLQERRTALISAAVTGQIDVRPH